MQVLFGPAKSQTLVSPILIELYRYWDAKRGSRLFPARGDIDPTEIKRCLPYLILSDVHHDPLRFRYRLVGTGVVGLAGRGELTGKWIDEETFGDFAKPVQTLYRSIVESKHPARAYGQVRQLQGREWMTLEDIFLPLGDTDDEVTMIMVGVVNATASAPDQDDDALHVAADPIVA